VRILFLSDKWAPYPGGAESYVTNVASALFMRGHQIGVLTSYPRALQPGWNQNFDITVEQILTQWEDISAAERSLWVKIKLNEFKPDIVFVNRFFAEDKCGFAPALKDYKVAEIVHNFISFPGAKFRLFNSKYTMNRQENCLNIAPSMVILPPSYVQHDIPLIDNRIGMVKPHQGKGVGTFYQIADMSPRERFAILRGEVHPAVEDIRDKLNITFIPPVENMSEFYEMCRIVLVPSLMEDAGTIPQDCARAGRPCISSAVMGLRETNAGGVLIENAQNVEVWMDAIRRFSERKGYYEEVVARQRAYIDSINWPAKFDELDARLRNL
jgi:glycosyltransferase involved in cell wall biosynthesis